MGVWRGPQKRKQGLWSGEPQRLGTVGPLQCSRQASAEELEETGLAVGFAGTLLEGALGERAQAEGAGEVVGVEAAAQRRHAAARHWESACGAQ